MITNLFLNIVAISISTSLIIIFLLIFAPFLNKRYAIKWKYLMWVVIAVRLIIPFHMDIPFAQIVIDVPEAITVPINTNNENKAPIMPQTEPKPIEVNNGNVAQSSLQPEPLKISLLDITAYLWLTGCLLFLSVHIFSFLHYKRRITKKSRVVKERYILQQVYRLSRKLRIKPNIRILRYEDAESPMVLGFLKPMVVLPDCDYSDEELYFILKHELIHIKRHDIYFKLLFVLANALHWFNPFIYIMQREAVVDMELSCDEKVIRKTAYAVRKAYTETLFSTFNKQRKKGASLTTQFYGGKKIMKKRFKNILTKSPKKSGLLLSICVICITLIAGMLIGCSAIKDDSSKKLGQIENDLSEEPTQTDLDTINPGFEDNANTQTDSKDNNTTNIFSGTPNENIDIPPEQPLESEDNNYKSILLGKSNFICTDLANKSLNIGEIGQTVTDDDSVTVSAAKFAKIDLDGDGKEEIVLWLRINGISDYGFEILHDQNGEIYGYTLQYRAFMNLKTDATFLYSSGAADFGIGKMNFSETGYSINGQTYSQSEYDSDNEPIVHYFVNDESCPEGEFNDVINAQEQKADVEWYDLSENNINAVLK